MARRFSIGDRLRASSSIASTRSSVGCISMLDEPKADEPRAQARRSRRPPSARGPAAIHGRQSEANSAASRKARASADSESGCVWCGRLCSSREQAAVNEHGALLVVGVLLIVQA